MQLSAVIESLMKSESKLHHWVKAVFNEVRAPQKLMVKIVNGANAQLYGKNKTRGANPLSNRMARTVLSPA